MKALTHSCKCKLHGRKFEYIYIYIKFEFFEREKKNNETRLASGLARNLKRAGPKNAGPHINFHTQISWGVTPILPTTNTKEAMKQVVQFSPQRR